MDFLERDLEDIIYDTPSEYLYKRGLNVYGKRIRQLRLGNYGIADLVTIRKRFTPEEDNCFSYHEFFITIYELKKGNINISTYLQAIRYCRAIQRIFEKRKINAHFKFKIVLVGKTLDISSDFVYLTEFNDMVELYTYQYKIDGLYFKSHYGYKLTHEDLPFTNKNNVEK